MFIRSLFFAPAGTWERKPARSSGAPLGQSIQLLHPVLSEGGASESTASRPVRSSSLSLWIWLKNKVSAVCKETCPPYLGLVKLCNLRHNIFVYKIPRWLWKMWKEKGQTFKKWKKRKQPIILPLGGPLLTFYVHISRFYHGNTYLLHIHELTLVSCSLTLLQLLK